MNRRKARKKLVFMMKLYVKSISVLDIKNSALSSTIV